MNRYGYILIAAAIVSAMLTMPLAHYADTGNPSRKTIIAGSINRSYLVYRPAGTGTVDKLPLVIVLHGASANGLVMSNYSGFNELAEKNTFIVLYPDSLGPLWNDGRVDMDSISFRSGVDDVQFIFQVVDGMIADSQVDPGRIYVAGFSNGGMMALRIGLAVPEKIAAVACVSGLLPKHLSLVRPGKEVPLLMMHGTDDRIVPWSGGVIMKGNKKHGEVLSVLDTLSFWARKNGCSSQVSVKILPDRDTRDGTVGFLINYACAGQDNEVSLISIQGGGHTWPGVVKSAPDSIDGKTSNDFNATKFIWDFFSRHKRH